MRIIAGEYSIRLTCALLSITRTLLVVGEVLQVERREKERVNLFLSLKLTAQPFPPISSPYSMSNSIMSSVLTKSLISAASFCIYQSITLLFVLVLVEPTIVPSYMHPNFVGDIGLADLVGFFHLGHHIYR